MAGYTNIGIIEKVGNGITKVKVGDTVASWVHHMFYAIVNEGGVEKLPEGVGV